MSVTGVTSKGVWPPSCEETVTQRRGIWAWGLSSGQNRPSAGCGELFVATNVQADGRDHPSAKREMLQQDAKLTQKGFLACCSLSIRYDLLTTSIRIETDQLAIQRQPGIEPFQGQIAVTW